VKKDCWLGISGPFLLAGNLPQQAEVFLTEKF
jgi:hypothetical protein